MLFRNLASLKRCPDTKHISDTQIISDQGLVANILFGNSGCASGYELRWG
jgi:hypothetical protein